MEKDNPSKDISNSNKEKLSQTPLKTPIPSVPKKIQMVPKKLPVKFGKSNVSMKKSLPPLPKNVPPKIPSNTINTSMDNNGTIKHPLIEKKMLSSSSPELSTPNNEQTMRSRKDSLTIAQEELEKETIKLMNKKRELEEKKLRLKALSEGDSKETKSLNDSSSENEEVLDKETVERIKSVIYTRKMNSKPLKPRALNPTLRRIMTIPPINKSDFSEEWDKFPNIISVVITKEPLDLIRPGECVSVKVKLVHLDDKSEVKIRSASFYRLVSDNGLIYQLKLQEGEVFLLLRLVEGDENLILVKPENSTQNVLQTQEYIKNKNSSFYYRPKAHSVFNTPLGVILEKNELDLFIKIMASPQDDSYNGGYRILFNTINNLDVSEFSITRKIEVLERDYRIPKNTFLKELITFLKEMDVRNNELKEKIRECEKLPVETPTQRVEEYIRAIIPILLQSKPNVLSKQNYNGKTILHYCCALGYASLIKDIIGKMKTSEINLLDINTRTALFFAVEAGHKGITKTLLEHGATWHNKDVRGETVIDIALRAEHISIIHLLNEVKEKHANQQRKNESSDVEQEGNLFSIHKAVIDNDLNGLKEFLSKFKKSKKSKSKENESILNSINDDGATALHLAAANGKLEILKELIKVGANVNAKDDGGSTPLHQAVASKHIECIKALLTVKDIDLELRDSTLQTPLIIAASLNFTEAVQILIDKGANINTGDERDFTPLHHACSYGYVDTTQVLLKAGANPDIATLSDGITPFHLAIKHGHHELVEILLESGVKINAHDSKALLLACENGHTLCTEILLAHNADPNIRDFENITPLHKAAENGHLKCIELLINAGADIDARDNENSTPLHKASFSGKKDCVSYLIKKKANLNAQDIYGATPLQNAAYRGHRTCVKMLVSNGANLEVRDDLGATAIQLASMNGHTKCVKLLASSGADINSADNEGLTSLMHAIPYPDVVTTLCQLGADVNKQDNKGQTALFHALMKKFETSAKILIEYNADTNICRNDKKTVFDIIPNELYNIIQDAIKAREEKGNLAIEKKWKEATLIFNKDPKEAIKYLVELKLIDNSPDGIARFLLKENLNLDAALLGEYLSHKNNGEILKAFLRRLQFDQKQLDIALREYLQLFLLPGEAQQIERMMEAFANRYVENNPDSFPDSDTAFIISFALIMLNTDLHNPSIPKNRKMTKAQFIYNHRGLWGPKHEDPPEEILEMFYDNIAAQPFKFRTADVSEKEGQLKKQGGRLGIWQSYWFHLKDQCLFYYRHKTDEEPVGLVPLENVVVKQKKNKFTLQALDGGLIKSCKLTKGTIVQGTAHEISIAADKVEEADAWVQAINSQISSNPFHEMISKRSEELAEKQRGKGELFGQVGAIVNFREFYSLALLCESCYKSVNHIKKQYGTAAIACVGECRSLRFFLIKDDACKKQHLILVGNLWTEQVKKHELDENFDWKDHFKIDQTVEAILDIVEDYMHKDYILQLTGHSLGAILAIFMGKTFQQNGFKIIKVVTFGQPNIMLRNDYQNFKTLNILRIIDIMDPVDSFFAGRVHIGRQVTILNKNFFCYENKVEKSLSTSTSSVPSDSILLNINKPMANSAPSSSKFSKKDSKNVSIQKELLKEKRNYKPGASVENKLQYHSIEYYLKRLKLKLKTDTQHIDAKDKYYYR